MGAEPTVRHVPAVVIGTLRRGWVSVLLHPGSGMADGGIRHELPPSTLPPELRVPNSRLLLHVVIGGGRFDVLGVEPDRTAEREAPPSRAAQPEGAGFWNRLRHIFKR